MPTVGIDHIAMPTSNAERLIQFYKNLGFTINDEAEWRAGTANIFSIQIGDSKINVHRRVTPPLFGAPPPFLAVQTSVSSGTAPLRNAKKCWLIWE